MTWGRGFYDSRAGGGAVDQVLAEMAEKARLREQQQRQAELQQQQMQHEEALNQRRIQSQILAAYLGNPSENTYRTMTASGMLGAMSLPPYQPSDQEQFGRSFWGDVRRADPSQPLMVDPLRAALVNPDLASAAPFMNAASQRYTYGQPQGALPPRVITAQEVADDLRLSAPELDTSNLAWNKRATIEQPESRANVRNTNAQTGLFGAQTGLAGAQTALTGAQTDKTREETKTERTKATGGTSDYKELRRTRITEVIDDLVPRVGPTTVGFGAMMRNVPNSPARNFKADLDTLKANIAFGELQEMRDASKTGGALGQVAIREIELLESALGGLDQGQGAGNMKKNLGKIRASVERWNQAKGGGEKTVTRDELRRLGRTEAEAKANGYTVTD